MSLTKRIALVAGAALALGGSAWAQSALDQGRAQAAELLADASTRTSALAQNQAFTPNIHGLLQFRFNWNNRDEDDAFAGDEENAIGFQAARTRLWVDGNIFSNEWYYFVEFEVGPEGEVSLLDAFGRYTFANGWNAQWGQFRLPFLRETLVRESHTLAADKSQFETVFGTGRGQGVQFAYTADQMRFHAAISDGAGTANTDFTSDAEADVGLTARAEFKWAGDWSAADDFTSFRGSPNFGMVGVAAHFQNGGDTFATADESRWGLTADVSVEGDGWNVFAAAVYSRVDPDPGSGLNDWGVLVQGGVFLGENTELFGRWDIIIPDDDRAADENFNTITVGLNQYMIPKSHAAKFTVDFQWYLDNPSESIVVPNTLTGLLAADSDDQWNLRAQIQLLFP